MSQQYIKQIRGASQGSILFLGTNSIVSEDFDKLNWSQSTNTLYVGGTLKINDGNQQSGYVLTSDGDGNATWESIGTGSTASGAYWLDSSNLSYMNLGVSQSTGDIRYIDFDTTYTQPVPEGRLAWNVDDGTLDLGLNSDVTLQIGQEMHYRVKNQTGATIFNGRLVSAVGTLGASGKILASYSIADGSVPAKYVMGIATENILNGSDGYVTHFGLVRGIDATGAPYGETWNDGDVLWANPYIPGGLTNVEPQPGGTFNIKVIVALVINNTSNGSIFVRVSNGYKLHELHDVEYDSNLLTDDSILKWTTSGQYWTQSINSFDNLSNVNIISATSNDTLRYDGSNWVNTSFVKSDSSGTFSINGTFRYIDGNQQNGYVLKSDSNGFAIWSPADHGSLSGLSDDDHIQYLLVSGSRALSGNLDVGGNNITNVNLVDGVDVSSHSTRHLPNGSDALTTGTPSSIGTTNQIGIQNAFSRQDHIHALGANVVADDNIVSHTSTKISITNKNQLNTSIAYIDQANIFGTFSQSFKSGNFSIFNPSNTFSYGFTSSAIVANRNVLLPLLTSDDIFVFQSFSQSLTNKTLLSTNNNVIDATKLQTFTVSTSTPSTNNVLVWNGSQWSPTTIRTTSSLTTTNATTTTIATASIMDNSTSIMEVYVKAYQASATNWGVWKRTLTLTKVSGTLTIREENADVDKQSTGLRASSVSFSTSSGSLLIRVTGIAATTISWNSAYEIIL